MSQRTAVFEQFVALIALGLLAYTFGQRPVVPQEPASTIEGEMTVQVYFPNADFTRDVLSCTSVFPRERRVREGRELRRSALEELLVGPTESEFAQGYFTEINEGVRVNDFFVRGGIAYVDFNKQIEFEVGSACRTAAIRQQIVETLEQFPEIEGVVILVEGRVEDVLQP